MIDSHTHTYFSHDGKMDIRDLVAKGKEKELVYLAITEHLDRDYFYGTKEKFVRQLNLKKYQDTFKKVKEETEGIFLACGVECGFALQAQKRYEKDLSKYKFDVIINSVHSVNRKDLYFLSPNKLGEKFTLYARYLETVLESVRHHIDYDIVGHLGYVARYAKFENREVYDDELKLIVDEILKEIISRGKTLELNAHTKDLGIPCLPEKKILERYFELGGRNISYGSDAHIVERVGDKYDIIASLAKEIGFTEWTVYKEREAHKINII